MAHGIRWGDVGRGIGGRDSPQEITSFRRQTAVWQRVKYSIDKFISNLLLIFSFISCQVMSQKTMYIFKFSLSWNPLSVYEVVKFSSRECNLCKTIIVSSD